MTHHTGSVPEMKRKADWRDQSACRDQDPEGWFPSATNGHAVKAAKGYCFACPVMVQCAQFALRTRQDVGVWGGLSEGQRTTLVKKHRTGAFEHLDTVRGLVLASLRQELNPIHSIRDLWEDRTHDLPGGHIGWKGDTGSFSFDGHVYTPKQLSFLLDRGHKAAGIVRRLPECPVVECVNPRHLADNEERYQRKQAEEHAAAQAAAREQYAVDELAS
ncbi:WhiB family transcriptional regulator [Streptomyces luteogriseus]|uniref:WhiB family transcriptional regulator n=1 Tax=Streptomyces luteogriseus TaxID=68233 RepID=UPI00371458D7